MSKTALQHYKFARAIVGGAGITSALIEAGYSPAQARKGWAIVNKSRGLRLALRQQARLLIELGQAFTPEEQEWLVRGRLISNVLIGTDKGTASARALGNDKRVAMFTPDTQQGIVVLSAPFALQDSHPPKQKPDLDE